MDQGGITLGDDDDDGHQQPSGDRDRQEQEEPQSEAEEEAEQEQIERLNCINIFYKYTHSNINSNTETKSINLILKSGIAVVKVVSGKLWILGLLISINIKLRRHREDLGLLAGLDPTVVSPAGQSLCPPTPSHVDLAHYYRGR